MEFKSIMHVSFYTDLFEEMLDFYCNKLGLKQKVVVKWKDYKGREDRPGLARLAETDPEGIFYTYIEIAPGQFVELFPASPDQLPHTEWNKNVGYSHFSLLVDDIFETKKQLLEAGVELDTDATKGPSETWQMWAHDPDGNKFEIMQYTENSFLVKGHIV